MGRVQSMSISHCDLDVLLNITVDLLLYNNTTGKLRVLIMEFDNRELTAEVDNEDGNYFSVSSVINRDYCLLHGYDYKQVVTNQKTLHDEVMKKYKPEIDVGQADTAKNSASCYNVGLNQVTQL